MPFKGRLDVRNPLLAGCAVLAGGVLAPLAIAGGVTLQPKAGEPLPGLTTEQLELFETGKQRFLVPLEVEEGLGPIFNKAGCFSCHTNPLGGWGSITVTRFGFADKGFFDPLAEFGGSLLQAAAISGGCEESIPAEANVVAQRVTNSSMAFGLVEAIPDADILANADPDDLNGDGISGRARIAEVVEDPDNPRVGRFGWKAQVATVLTFSADASVMEMGLTNRFFGTENAPNGDPLILAACDNIPDPEDGPDAGGFDFIDRVTHFQRYLGVPPQTPKSGMTGEALFNQVGCAQCHVPQWQTADDPALEDSIRNKPLRPYSDFLLHDMGLLGDGIFDGDPFDLDHAATELEIRTPTLWNLRTRDPMLHDGRAAGGTFFDRVAGPNGAIWWHGVFGSEAKPSAEAFFALSPDDQAKVVAFLDSLGRLEFDFDGNGHVAIGDYIDMKACNGQNGVTPDDTCAIADVDQNGAIDSADALLFISAYEDPNGDCNGNGVSDLEEILVGGAIDADNDTIPDDCQGACQGDLDGSGAVDGGDLGLLLSQWGGAGAGDLDGSGTVDGGDLGLLLSAWGACK